MDFNNKNGISVSRSGDRETKITSRDIMFFGDVFIDNLYLGKSFQHLKIAKMSFNLGARTEWQMHSDERILIITSGSGWVQEWGDSIKLVQTGDIVYILPDIKYWYGATDKSSMNNILLSRS
ncbi:hypothetical protein [uncultured Tolumonas sp.]|uniref:hypothetical protein n=1 Tax=uncultured Tolumonas sp. TaxID=263765 RepID=UPI002A0A8589|nr:hypothetical protein [uncultured Tolumonas sp.]